MRFIWIGLALCLSAGVCGQPSNSIQSSYRKIELMVPMRDGIKLYTSVYVPRNVPGKHPILMERTPYGAGPVGPERYRSGFRGSKKLQDAGFIFAYQDVRGMGASEGKFENIRPQLIDGGRPHDIDESTDTYDAVEYLINHVPDNNGRVGLWGISYPGFYAAVGAINSHPALRAVSPQAPVSNWFIGDDFHHHGAMFLMDAIRFARFGESKDIPREGRQNISYGGDAYKFLLEKKTIATLTKQYFDNTDGVWYSIVSHPNYDDFWQARDTRHNLKNIRCAVMTVGGFFDAEDLWGAIHTYLATEKQNKTFNTLVMGPWYHGMWAAPSGNKFGDIDFGQPTSTFYQDQIEFPFFDAFLRTGTTPRLPEAFIFETGSNLWRRFSSWPPKGMKETSYYFAPGSGLALSPPAPDRGRPYDEFVSDPDSPVPYQGGTITGRTREYMIDDQRFAAKRTDVLSYQTAPLTQDVTIAGPIQADIVLATTGTDADLVVKVIDVFPAGTKNSANKDLSDYQMLVRAEVMRCKYNLSYQNPQPLMQKRPQRVSFELPDTAHTFKKGHRMMVQVQASWYPLVDMNPQTFTNIYTCLPSAFQKATMQVYRSGSQLSRIRVGVLPAMK